MQCKAKAFGNGRVIIGPEDHQRVWIGVRQRFFSEQLEILRRGFRLVWHDPVDYLQPVDVGLMLKVAAEPVGDRLAQE